MMSTSNSRVMMSMAVMVLSLFLCLCGAQQQQRPVVLWHGMGDDCCNPQSMGAIKGFIEQQYPGIYVYSMEIGDTPGQDTENGFLMNVNLQLEQAFQKLNADPNLQDGFNAIGFSQGGQFLRGYVERYNVPPVYNLITLGGQHQGVYGFPRCPGQNETLCEITQKLIDLGVYVDFVQDHLVQAEYWQDPLNYDEYLAKSVFLADINNQKTEKNATYKENLVTLNLFVMVKFTEDTMVYPRESEWFEFFAPGQDKFIVPLNQSQIYTEDWIGLQELDANNKLVFIPCVGNHLQFTEQWFIEYIVVPYLNNTL